MTSKVETRRIGLLDVVKFFAIYQVVWGHATQYALENSIEHQIFHPFFYNNAFHMPLFMTLCGIFASSSLKYSFPKLLKTKVMQLIVPAFVWTACAILLLFLRGKNAFEVFPVMNWVTNYWFVECLFVCYLLFWTSMKLLKNDVLSCVVTMVLVLTVDKGTFLWVNSMLPFFWLGHFMKRKIMEERMDYHLLISSGIVFILMLMGWSQDYTIYENSSNFYTWGARGLNERNFFVMTYRFVTGASGSLFFIMLWKAVFPLIEKTWLGHFMSKYGQETLAIYMIHTLAIVALAHVYVLPESTNIYLFDFGYVHVYNILTIVISVVIIEFFSKFKLGRVLFLGKRG